MATHRPCAQCGSAHVVAIALSTGHGLRCDACGHIFDVERASKAGTRGAEVLVQCASCHGTVVVGYATEPSGLPQPNIWFCPYCGSANDLTLVGSVCDVARHSQG